MGKKFAKTESVCPVCFASAGNQEPKDLSMEEISRQYNILMQRGGSFNIQPISYFGRCL